MSHGNPGSEDALPSREATDSRRFMDIASMLTEEGYVLGPKIGSGSHSKVRLVEKISQSKTLAVKIIDTEAAPNEYVKTFLPNELDILSKVRHENIVSVDEIFKKEKLVFIVMEYAEQGDLLEYIINNGPPSENEARLWFRQLVSAVHYLHKNGFAHRDIKCENILITKTGDLLLTDFGFACTLDGNTPCTTFCGSAAYASPQLLMAQPYDPVENDVWSLGCMLFILMCGSMPYDDSNIKTLLKRQQERVRYPAKYIDVLDPEVKALIRHLLEPDPEKRPCTSDILRASWLNPGSSNLIIAD